MLWPPCTVMQSLFGGERKAVECLVKMTARKCEMHKQVVGEDDGCLEKRGRILNRVMKWKRGGITIEADQRHVREILKDLSLKQVNLLTTPCVVGWTNCTSCEKIRNGMQDA